MTDLDILSEHLLNGWVLSLMSVCIPLQFMHEVIDKFREKGWNYLYRLVVTYLLFSKEGLMLASDQAEFLSSLNNKNSRELGIEWKEMISSADKLNF